MRKRSVSSILFTCWVAGCTAWLAATGAAQEKTAKGDVARGKTVFENSCQECHDAYSRDETTGPGLQGLKSGKLPDGRPATHDKLLDIVNSGPAEMPAFKDRLTEQQKEDVVAFLMTL